MCMKNLNSNIIIFSDVSPDFDNDDLFNILGANKKVPFVPVKKSDEEGILIIPNLRFLVSINALESLDDDKKDGEKKPVHKDTENPDTTLFFNKKYEFCIRLTELSTGGFVDLDLRPLDLEHYDELCRKVYSKMLLFDFKNINVAKPNKDNRPKKKTYKYEYVLKFLIRRQDSEEKLWNVQSVHPFKLKWTSETDKQIS